MKTLVLLALQSWLSKESDASSAHLPVSQVWQLLALPHLNKKDHYHPLHTTKPGVPQVGSDPLPRAVRADRKACQLYEAFRKTKVIGHHDFNGQKSQFASQPDRKRRKVQKWLSRAMADRYTHTELVSFSLLKGQSLCKELWKGLLSSLGFEC